MPKIGNCKSLGRPADHNILRFQPETSIIFIKRIRHDILKQCHGHYMEMKEFNYMLVNDILRNSSQKIRCPKGCFFYGFGWSKDAQTPCWLRLWSDTNIFLLVIIMVEH